MNDMATHNVLAYLCDRFEKRKFERKLTSAQQNWLYELKKRVNTDLRSSLFFKCWFSLTASYYKQHFLNSDTCQKNNISVRIELVEFRPESTSVLCHVKDRFEMKLVFVKRKLDNVLNSCLRIVTDGHVYIKPTILQQADAMYTTKEVQYIQNSLNMCFRFEN